MENDKCIAAVFIVLIVGFAFVACTAIVKGTQYHCRVTGLAQGQTAVSVKELCQ